MKRKLKAFFVLFLLLVTLPLVISHIRIAYYDYRYSRPIQEGRLPDEVLNISLNGGADYEVEVRDGWITLMENDSSVERIRVNVSEDFTGYGRYLLFNGTLYVVAVSEVGIVGIEGFYRDFDVLYHLQNRYLWAFDLDDGKLKWHYHEIMGCKLGEGCYPFGPGLKFQNGKLYVSFSPHENRTLVFSP